MCWVAPARNGLHSGSGDSDIEDREVFVADGIGIIKTCVHAPRANAVAERFVETVRRECLDRMLILGRRHLEAVLAEYLDHYNDHRPHRSIDQRSPRHGTAAPHEIREADLAKLRRTRSSGRAHPSVPTGRMNCSDGVSVPTGPNRESTHGRVVRGSALTKPRSTDFRP